MDTLGEGFEGFIASASLALLDDFLSNDMTHVFDGVESKANITAIGIFFVWHNSKLFKAFIDVWRKNLDTHFSGFMYFDSDTIDIILVTCEKSRHEFSRVVGFEVGGLISNQGIAGGVRTIESVPSKRFDKNKHFFTNVFPDASSDASFHEFFTLLLYET